MTQRLQSHLAQGPADDLADIAFTLQVSRGGFAVRRAIVVHDADDALAALGDSARWLDHRTRRHNPKIRLVTPAGVPAAWWPELAAALAARGETRSAGGPDADRESALAALTDWLAKLGVHPLTEPADTGALPPAAHASGAPAADQAGTVPHGASTHAAHPAGTDSHPASTHAAHPASTDSHRAGAHAAHPAGPDSHPAGAHAAHPAGTDSHRAGAAAAHQAGAEEIVVAPEPGRTAADWLLHAGPAVAGRLPHRLARAARRPGPPGRAAYLPVPAASLLG
jgi:hypothetical protein